MKRLNSILALIFVVALFIFLFWIGIQTVSFFKNSSDNVKAASIAAMATVVTFLLGRYLEQRRELRQRINSEKIEVYKAFFEIYFNLFSNAKPGGNNQSNEELVQKLLEFQKQLIFWGSDEVMKSYLDFRKKSLEFND